MSERRAQPPRRPSLSAGTSGASTDAERPAGADAPSPGSDAGHRFIAYSDGASRGNPGPASIGGVVLDDQGATLATVSRRIGRATNNEAEYRAAIAVVEAAMALGATTLELRMDSELVARQLSGRYRVRNPSLMPHYQRLDTLRRRFQHFSVVHVRREFNRQADALANAALDAREA